MHDEVAGKADSRIDLNRAGTPLLEIVSQPDLRSPAEAKAYLTELKLLLELPRRLRLQHAGREPAGRRQHQPAHRHAPRQNRHADRRSEEHEQLPGGRAGAGYEAQRQWQEWQETGHKLGDVPKSTRGWDEASQTTHEQRSKEESSDYRYFPDPDLVPVTVTEEEIERVRASLGELPAALAHAARTDLRHHALR